MINTLIERDLWSMERKKEAMEKINPILNKLSEAVIDCHYNTEKLYDKSEETVENYDWDTVIRKYIEADIWDSFGMIVLNVLPSENKELFDSFKKVFAEYGVREYKKENDADSKKRKLKAQFNLFQYKSYKDDYELDYSVDVIFRGDLPETCILEYTETYEEIDNDAYVVRKGKVMRKETSVKVVCDDMSVLRLPQATA